MKLNPKLVSDIQNFDNMSYEDKKDLLDKIPARIVGGFYADFTDNDQLKDLFTEWYSYLGTDRDKYSRKRIKATIKACKKKKRDISFLDNKFMDI